MADAAAELNAKGVCIVRSACQEAVCDACLDEVLASLERMLTLPGRSNGRHFLRFPLIPGAVVSKDPEHQRDFKPEFSPCVEAVVRAALKGQAGTILAAALGRGAELYELTAITSEPGATEQMLHADGCWQASAPRVVTMFLALHDILDEAMGPTSFCPETHAPRCFPDETWLPPPDTSSRPNSGAAEKLAEKPPAWFGLKAGDAVLMYSTTWHRGGANKSERRRSLLSLSFVEPSQAGNSEGRLRVADVQAAAIAPPRAGEDDESGPKLRPSKTSENAISPTSSLPLPSWVMPIRVFRLSGEVILAFEHPVTTSTSIHHLKQAIKAKTQKSTSAMRISLTKVRHFFDGIYCSDNPQSVQVIAGDDERRNLPAEIEEKQKWGEEGGENGAFSLGDIQGRKEDVCCLCWFVGEDSGSDEATISCTAGSTSSPWRADTRRALPDQITAFCSGSRRGAAATIGAPCLPQKDGHNVATILSLRKAFAALNLDQLPQHITRKVVGMSIDTRFSSWKAAAEKAGQQCLTLDCRGCGLKYDVWFKQTDRVIDLKLAVVKAHSEIGRLDVEQFAALRLCDTNLCIPKPLISASATCFKVLQSSLKFYRGQYIREIWCDAMPLKFWWCELKSGEAEEHGGSLSLLVNNY